MPHARKLVVYDAFEVAPRALLPEGMESVDEGMPQSDDLVGGYLFLELVPVLVSNIVPMVKCIRPDVLRYSHLLFESRIQSIYHGDLLSSVLQEFMLWDDLRL